MSSPQKHVIVTGSAQGIGRCIARTFAEKGWKVFLIDVQEVRPSASTRNSLSHPANHSIPRSRANSNTPPKSISSPTTTRNKSHTPSATCATLPRSAQRSSQQRTSSAAQSMSSSIMHQLQTQSGKMARRSRTRRRWRSGRHTLRRT